jgi:magnesium transporter
MLRCKLVCEHSDIQVGGEELIDVWRETPDSRIWIDVQIDDVDRVKRFLNQMGCHPLAITDALRKRHPPKFEPFDEHLFILYRGILNVSDNLVFEHQTVAFFITERSVISVHPGKSIGVEYIWEHQKQPLLKGTYEVALQVMHYSAGIYLDTILQFEAELSDLEDAVQDHGNDEMLAQLTSYRAKLLRLKRVFNYHETVSKKLLSTTDSYAGVRISDDRYTHLANDVHDRFERLHSLTQMHYEICGDLIEGYLSIASHQLNVTMRILTVITAVFVPLSFMAGLYGMNFEHMPELKVHYGYYYLLGAMLTCAAGLIYFFKRRRWF